MRRALALVLVVLGTATGAEAAWERQGPVFAIIEENDLFVHTDRHYTQGVKLSFLQADGDVPDWARWILRHVPLEFPEDAARLGYLRGQSIFTPANLYTSELQKGERPYAGWLYGGLILQRRGTVARRFPAQESFQLELGVIGPHAFAEEAQTAVHEIRGFDLPKGWEHQLHDEPGLALKYQRAWLFSPTATGPRWLDFIPHAGASVGNVETSLRVGNALRVGINLPDDFGVATISSLASADGGRSARPRWGAYVLAGAELSWVLYTAFLDGNLVRDSPSVRKEPIVVEWKLSMGLVLNAVELGLTYVYRTPQFEGQRKDDAYGSVTLKVKF